MAASLRRQFQLEHSDRQHLLELTRKGKSSARMITRARILLLSHDGHRDTHIQEVLQVGSATITRIRRRYRVEGLHSALQEKPRPGAKPKLKADHYDALRAVLATAPPEGTKQWSLRLLADQLVRMQFVENISHETIRHALRKVGMQNTSLTRLP